MITVSDLAFLALVVLLAAAAAWFIVNASELRLTLPFGVSLVAVH